MLFRSYLSDLMVSLSVDTKYDVKVTGQASRNGKTRERQGFAYEIGQATKDALQAEVGGEIHAVQETIKGGYEFTVYAGAEAINKVLQTENSAGFAEYMANQTHDTWENAGTSNIGEASKNSLSAETWQPGQNILLELASIGVELVPALKPVKAAKELAETGKDLFRGDRKSVV